MADSEQNEGRQSNTSDDTNGSNNAAENSAICERQVIDECQERQPLGQSMSAPPTCGAHASQVSLVHIPELRRNVSNPSEEERRDLTSSESASTSGYSSTDLLEEGNLERSSDVFMPPPAERKDYVGKDSDKAPEPEGPSPCSIEVAEITARIERNDTETSEITPDGLCSPVAESASDDSDSKSKDLCLSIPSIDATSSSKQTSDGANAIEFSTISVEASSESFQTGVVSFSDDTPLNIPKPIARCVTPDSSTLLADSVPDNSLGVFEARTETTTESLCVGCAAQCSDTAAGGLSLVSHDSTIVNLSGSISTSVSVDSLGNSANSFITGNSNAIHQGTEQTTVDSSVTEEIFACTASDIPFPSMIDYSSSASVCSEAATQTEDYSDVTEPVPLFNISPSPSRVVLRGDINGAFSLDMTYGDGEESTLFFPAIEEPEIEPSPCSVEVSKIIDGSGNSRDSFTPPNLKLEPWVLPHNGKNAQTGVQAFSDVTPTNVPRPVVTIPVCPEENSLISPKPSSSGNLTTLGADSAFKSCGVRPKTRQFGGSGEDCLDPSSTEPCPCSTDQEVIKLSSYNSVGARRRRDSFTRESHRDHPYAHVEEPLSRRRSMNDQAIIKSNVEKFFKELRHTQASELRHNEIQENTISSTIAAASDDSCDALDGRRSRIENRNTEESTAASMSRFQSDFAPSASIINHYFELDTEGWPYGRVSVSPSIDIDPEIEEGIRALAEFNPDLVRPLSRIITPENVMPDGLQSDHQPSSRERSPIQHLDELGAVAGSTGDNASVKGLMADTQADDRTDTLTSVDASGDFVYLGGSASDEPPCASSPGGAVSSSEMSSGFARSEETRDDSTHATEYPVEMENLGASDVSRGEPRCVLDQETLDGVRRRIQNMGITISDFLKYFHVSSAEFRPRPRTARNLLPGDPFIEGVIRWFVADVGYEYAEQAYVGFKWGPSTTRESSSQTSPSEEVVVQQTMRESEPPQTAEGQTSQDNTRSYIWSVWAPLVQRGSMPRMNAGPSFYTPYVPGQCSSYPFLPVPPFVTCDQIRCTLPTVQIDHSEVSNETENVQHGDHSPSILLTTGQVADCAVANETENVRQKEQSSSVLLPTAKTSPSAAVNEAENGRQKDRSSSVLLPTGQITPSAIANEAESAQQQDQSCSVPQSTEQQETLTDVGQSEGGQIARQEISEEMLVEEQENMPPNEPGEAADQNRNRTPEAKKKSPLIVRSRSRTK